MSERNEAIGAPAGAAQPSVEANGEATKPADSRKPQSAQAAQKMVEPKDSNREFLETVVFVVFLVLLLKAFVAEAFVIPTGSMATTLLGDHCDVTCEKCKYRYYVNAQSNNRIMERVSATCPNCQHQVEIFPVNADGGDKVLVFKSRFDYAKPDRHDVIVFKFPGEPDYLSNSHADAPDRRSGGPQKEGIAHNYIKRLWGIPGDRLAIWYGDVYRRIGTGDRERLEIIRRSPDKYLAMRRIVNHHDFQDHTLPPRWRDEAQPPVWTNADDNKAFAIEKSEAWNWVTYRHILRSSDIPEFEPPNGRPPMPNEKADAARPQLITDTLEYNSVSSYNWTPDLMTEFDVHVQESTGRLAIELAGGVDLHRAVFDLSKGRCTLETLRDGKRSAYQDENGNELPAEKAQADTKLGKTGKHTVRFCSFDQRLTLWVDDKLIFGDGLIFPAPRDEERGPRLADLQPLRIGAQQAKLKLAKLQLYRDVYYTREIAADVSGSREMVRLSREVESQLSATESARLTAEERRLPADEQQRLIAHRARPEKWSAYYFRGNANFERRMEGPAYYPKVHSVHHPSDALGPDEYFALGDNSTQSSDSRVWGQIPERLLLGKAVSVYYPIPSRFGLIR